MIITLIALILGMLILGVPIYIGLLLSTMLCLLIFTDISPMIAIQRAFGGIDKFVLMSLPFYILTASAMDVGGLSQRMLRWARTLVGHLPGGQAMTVQTAAMFFGALSGSSPATVAAIGKVMYPEMLRTRYPKHFASGLVIQSGAVSLLIPPSVTMILYASATDASVGALFMGGLSAGIVFGLVMLAYIYFHSKRAGYPRDERNWGEVWSATKEAAWALGVPLIIICGISFGIFTPTEAAGASTIYALFVGIFIYKEIDMKKLYQLSLSAAKTSAQVMILIAGASALGWILTVGQGPQMLAAFLNENFTAAWTFLLFLNVILLILGMFLEASIALIVIGPLILTSAVGLGIDPIHLGVIMVFNLAIGTFTPPFGLNIFVAKSVTGLSVVEMVPGLTRFLIVSIAVLLVVTYIPAISTYVPNMIYK
ncbi:TRAP transporter large permease [Paenibacillaceae bacterium WGS1546]|uniref:TRAP transporter large permease n=1 Tax=Cohnella sp. WGS1546 TaxID=3366810 RepID=UPI00372CFF94